MEYELQAMFGYQRTNMQIITKYKAKDGSEWDSELAATTREQLIDEVDKAMQPLGSTPREVSGEINTEGYVQQTKEVVLACKASLFDIANRPEILKTWIDRQKNENGKTDKSLIGEVHPSWFGRMLDGDCAPLGDAYQRLCCIDEQYREWNQGYFAKNPPKDPECLRAIDQNNKEP